MKTCNLIFPHQLFEQNPLFQIEGQFFLIEEFLFFNQYNFHKQKIAFHRATMKYYENYLLKQKIQVTYIEAQQQVADVRKLIPHLALSGTTTIAIIDPVDNWLLNRIESGCQQNGIGLKVLDSPMFLNASEELNEFFTPTKKRYFQTEFYKKERIKRKILLDKKNEPLGGQWSFDIENRKKYPKGKSVPDVEFPLANIYTKEAIAYTQKYFPMNLGKLTMQHSYPIGYDESNSWLEQFISLRLAEFGDYEDAIVHQEILLNHSLLTPMLNVGMLIPQQVLNRTFSHSLRNNIPINSLEGFIRQVIGWREFIRGVYVSKGGKERTLNFWGFTRKIPNSFYDGTTGIFPIDVTIKKVLETGYCHHIERLMVLGNFMLLCEFDPDEVYRWFMEMFVDAYDWVMVPNVYGMSQFADGGMMATKPYISGSNYLMKMSNYPKGDWQAIWDSLFWRFLDKQRHFFLQNPRLGLLVKTYDKWEESKKISVHKRAQAFLGKLNSAPTLE